MDKIILQNREWIYSTWNKIDRKFREVTLRSRDKLPYTAVDGVHDDRSQNSVNWWTNGFWGGLNWLLYVGTGNEEYKKTAERSEELLDGAFRKYKQLHHDVGFMWHLTSGANYRITGNADSCTRNLFAAATLASRYNVEGDYISAWNGKEVAGYSIIDCLMNLSLLYWASEEVCNDRFKKIAIRHMNMSLRDHIRPDGSVNHIVDHEQDRPAVHQILGGQGYSADSCWSRGVSWAVYGSVISYIHTGKEEYLEAAKRTADYFIEQCKKTNYLPLCDFCAPAEPVYYDSTGGLCAACGMLELAKYVSEADAARYTQEAIHILKACDEHFCNYDEAVDPLVLMGTERYPHDEASMRGVHIPIIYGDFFFVEAMLKLKGNAFLIW